jgi:hypothetical protein
MINRKGVLVFLLAILAMSITIDADAQFWKKKSETEKSKHKADVEKKRKEEEKRRKEKDKEREKRRQAEEKKRTNKEKEKERRREQRKKEKEERRKKKHEAQQPKPEVVKKEKKEKKEKKDKKKPLPLKKKEIKYPNTVLKSRYRIDVLTPMYLDDLVKGESITFKDKLPEKAQPGMAFYQGIKLAADSLKRAGFKIDIYIHDIASAAEAPEVLLGKGKLDSTDLIIGAVATKDIGQLAAFAGKKKINFISALSPADGGVKNNEFFTLLQPSLKSHCDWIYNDVATNNTGRAVTLFYRTGTIADENAYKYLTTDKVAPIPFNAIQCKKLPTKDSLRRIFDTTRPNLVIVSILDIGFADSLLREISRDFPNVHFEVYGMPTWSSIGSLQKAKAYRNLTVTLSVPFYFDPSQPLVQYIDKNCKAEFGVKPSELVYRGFETVYWYANLLKQYGTIFNGKYSDNSSAPLTRFDIKPQWDKNTNLLYNENTHIFLSKYEGGLFKTQ